MVRALIQSPAIPPASPGAHRRSARRLDIGPSSAPAASRRHPGATAQRPADGALPPGYGLLIGAGAALGLWAGLIKLVLMALR